MLKFFFLFFVSGIIYGQTVSVLAVGKWYKMGILNDGVYRLTGKELRSLGINIGNLNSSSIRIFGNGIKGILPQDNATKKPTDLLENKLFVEDGNDGKFDDEDFILFYGWSPHQSKWTVNGFQFEKNIYSDTSYYFLNIDPQRKGKRMLSNPATSSGIPEIIRAFDDAMVYEKDIHNIIRSGRAWYGEVFGKNERKKIVFQFPGITSHVFLKTHIIAQSPEHTRMNFYRNNTYFANVSMAAVPSRENSEYNIKASEAYAQLQITQTKDLELGLQFEANNGISRSYLDYLCFTFKKQPVLTDGQTTIRYADKTNTLFRYKFKKMENLFIWNITDSISPVVQLYQIQNDSVFFDSKSQEIEKFVLFDKSDFQKISSFQKIDLQNLHSDLDYDALIVTHPLFLSEAERLAQFHRSTDQLSIKVVTVQQIYNEFSSGRQDVSAIRDYLRFVREGSNQRLKYLLLFGDCSYDYKHRIANNTNFVPTYSSYASHHPVLSYASDDYFSFLENNEGKWEENKAGDHTMDIGVGRLPVKSLNEAKQVVDKIIHYSNKDETLGEWRVNLTYVADDGDAGSHVRNIETLAQFVDTSYARFRIQKIYLDNYPQLNDNYEDVSSDIEKSINKGSLLITYIGHGDERRWAQEEILNQASIKKLNNRKKLPIVLTATCEFGKFDDPEYVSAGENMLLGEHGAIALITTSRPVYSSTSTKLNQSFHRVFFGRKARLGDIFKETKNLTLDGWANRNFTLLGDPMIFPNFPENDIVVHSLQQRKDTISAFEKINYQGTIQEKNGTEITSFIGLLDVEVRDVAVTKETQGQQDGIKIQYKSRDDLLYKGKVSVKNGSFSITFFVPKNISYRNLTGKISLYALDRIQKSDASGGYDNIIIGGTSKINKLDRKSPEAQLYLESPSFVDGQKVGRSPLVIAKIYDENGVSMIGDGLFESISLELNGKKLKNVSSFFSYDTDSYQKGTLTYPLSNLSPGNYQLSLRVYDTRNNFVVRKANFVVSKNPLLNIYLEKLYPNPTKGNVTFEFEHGRQNEDFGVYLNIYDSFGKIIYDGYLHLSNVETRSHVKLNLYDILSGNPKSGIYYLKFLIYSSLDGARYEIVKKVKFSMY